MNAAPFMARTIALEAISNPLIRFSRSNFSYCYRYWYPIILCGQYLIFILLNLFHCFLIVLRLFLEKHIFLS